MKQKIVLFALISCLFISSYATEKIPEYSTAGFYSIDGSPRKVYNFNPGWKFQKGKIAGAERINFDDSNWESVNLPHGLEILEENASGMRNYQGEACYRKVFYLNNIPWYNLLYLHHFYTLYLQDNINILNYVKC